MALKGNKVNSGPIPGENYTSNTKNYPWHRPPKYTNLDDAIEASYKIMMENPSGLLTMLKAKIPVPSLVELFLLNGMGRGDWTPDYMILMAGPIAHIMYLMGKEAGIEPNMDLEDKSPKLTPGFVDMMKSIEKKTSSPKELNVDLNKVKQATSNFMSAGAEEELLDDTDDEGEDSEMPEAPEMSGMLGEEEPELEEEL